jgi:hypothetical protein
LKEIKKKILFNLEVGQEFIDFFLNKRDFDPRQACVKYKERTTFLKNMKNCTCNINVKGSEPGLLNQSTLV